MATRLARALREGIAAASASRAHDETRSETDDSSQSSYRPARDRALGERDLLRQSSSRSSSEVWYSASDLGSFGSDDDSSPALSPRKVSLPTVDEPGDLHAGANQTTEQQDIQQQNAQAECGPEEVRALRSPQRALCSMGMVNPFASSPLFGREVGRHVAEDKEASGEIQLSCENSINAPKPAETKLWQQQQQQQSSAFRAHTPDALNSRFYKSRASQSRTPDKDRKRTREGSGSHTAHTPDIMELDSVYRARVGELQRSVEILEKSFEAACTVTTSLHQEAHGLDTEAAEAAWNRRHELADAHRCIDNLRTQIDLNRNTIIKVKQAKDAELEVAKEEWRQRANAEREARTAAEEEVKALHASLQRQAEEDTVQHEQARTQARIQHDKIEDLIKEVTKRDQEVQDLLERNEALRTQKHQAEMARERAMMEASTLAEREQALREEAKESEMKAKDFEIKLALTSTQFAQHRDTAAAELAAVQQQFASLNDQHASLKEDHRVLQLSLEEAHGPCSAAAAELEGNIEGLKQELALVSEQLRASLAAEEKSREQVAHMMMERKGTSEMLVAAHESMVLLQQEMLAFGEILREEARVNRMFHKEVDGFAQALDVLDTVCIQMRLKHESTSVSDGPEPIVLGGDLEEAQEHEWTMVGIGADGFLDEQRSAGRPENAEFAADANDPDSPRSRRPSSLSASTVSVCSSSSRRVHRATPTALQQSGGGVEAVYVQQQDSPESERRIQAHSAHLVRQENMEKDQTIRDLNEKVQDLQAQLEGAELTRRELLALQDDLRRETTHAQLKMQAALDGIDLQTSKGHEMNESEMDQLRRLYHQESDNLHEQNKAQEARIQEMAVTLTTHGHVINVVEVGLADLKNELTVLPVAMKAEIDSLQVIMEGAIAEAEREARENSSNESAEYVRTKRELDTIKGRFEIAKRMLDDKDERIRGLEQRTIDCDRYKQKLEEKEARIKTLADEKDVLVKALEARLVEPGSSEEFSLNPSEKDGAGVGDAMFAALHGTGKRIMEEASLSKTFEVTQDQLQESKQTLDAKDARIQELEDKIGEKDQLLHGLNVRLLESAEDSRMLQDDLHREREKSELKLRVVVEEKAAINAKLAEVEAQHRLLQQQLVVASEELLSEDRRRQAIDAVRAEVENVLTLSQSKVSALEGTVTKLSAENEELHEKLNLVQNHRDELEKELLSVKEQVVNERAVQLEEKTRNIDLRQALAQTQDEFQTMHEECKKRLQCQVEISGQLRQQQKECHDKLQLRSQQLADIQSALTRLSQRLFFEIDDVDSLQQSEIQASFCAPTAPVADSAGSPMSPRSDRSSAMHTESEPGGIMAEGTLPADPGGVDAFAPQAGDFDRVTSLDIVNTIETRLHGLRAADSAKMRALEERAAHSEQRVRALEKELEVTKHGLLGEVKILKGLHRTSAQILVSKLDQAEADVSQMCQDIHDVQAMLRDAFKLQEKEKASMMNKALEDTGRLMAERQSLQAEVARLLGDNLRRSDEASAQSAQRLKEKVEQAEALFECQRARENTKLELKQAQERVLLLEGEVAMLSRVLSESRDEVAVQSKILCQLKSEMREAVRAAREEKASGEQQIAMMATKLSDADAHAEATLMEGRTERERAREALAARNQQVEDERVRMEAVVLQLQEMLSQALQDVPMQDATAQEGLTQACTALCKEFQRRDEEKEGEIKRIKDLLAAKGQVIGQVESDLSQCAEAQRKMEAAASTLSAQILRLRAINHRQSDQIKTLQGDTAQLQQHAAFLQEMLEKRELEREEWTAAWEDREKEWEDRERERAREQIQRSWRADKLSKTPAAGSNARRRR